MIPNNNDAEAREARKRSNYYNRTKYRTEKKFNIPHSSMFLWKAVANAMKISVNAFVVAACDEATEAFMNKMHGRKDWGGIDWISRVEQEMDKAKQVTDSDPPLPDVQFLSRLGRETESRSRPLRPVDGQDSDESDE